MTTKEKVNSSINNKKSLEKKLVIIILNLFTIPLSILCITYFFFYDYEILGCLLSIFALLGLLATLVYQFVQEEEKIVLIKED